MKFSVTFLETIEYEFIIEAASVEEAIELANKKDASEAVRIDTHDFEPIHVEKLQDITHD